MCHSFEYAPVNLSSMSSDSEASKQVSRAWGLGEREIFTTSCAKGPYADLLISLAVQTSTTTASASDSSFRLHTPDSLIG